MAQKMSKNKCGKLYFNGQRTDDQTRLQIIDLYTNGKTYQQMSDITGITRGGCQKVVKQFVASGSISRKLRRYRSPTKMTPNVLQFIEYEKKRQPSIYGREIRSDLLRRNVCSPDSLPSVRQINRAITEVLGMTRKLVQSVPTETKNHDQTIENFIARAMQFSPEQLHFFDEASVVRTAGNRRYGHAFRGEKAIEIQRYASNATFTVNVSCGYFGLDHFDIILGPSNAYEMLTFFDDLMQMNNDMGNPVLAHGDCIIMDNCGFHHHRAGEQLLRDMLGQRNITLLFQPPYCPEFNVTEYVFHLMRNKLRENSEFVYSFTELSIVNALTSIDKLCFPNIFRKCGYI
ncbi:uncharacterized protein LOC132563309 [Ylistrum balloti]|uniref:uncharacterized protein LOC132563309 n=1 Tax=Ylistrum balloti TaxID=509963 RepID=UPI002905AA1E|nr:uncharacterized protein LOC132563309 [Ylistrum balloti]